MAHLSLVDALAFVLRSVARLPASAFREECARLQLETVHLGEPVVDPPGFPKYDASHTFAFTTDDSAPGSLDLLEYRDEIIQVRLAVHYRPFLGFLFSKRTAHMKKLLPVLLARYGRGLPRPCPGEILIFADDRTDAYISCISAGPVQSLYVNVGDRHVWQRAGGEMALADA